MSDPEKPRGRGRPRAQEGISPESLRKREYRDRKRKTEEKLRQAEELHAAVLAKVSRSIAESLAHLWDALEQAAAAGDPLARELEKVRKANFNAISPVKHPSAAPNLLDAVYLSRLAAWFDPDTRETVEKMLARLEQR